MTPCQSNPTGVAVRQVIIIGTGGTCTDVLETLHDINVACGEKRWECAGFLDDNEALWGCEIAGVPVLGGLEDAGKYSDAWFINGIGSSRTFHRKRAIIAKTGIATARFLTVVHPAANVSSTARLGRGVAVLPHVTIGSYACIGDHVVVLPNSVISHDAQIGSYSCIAGGVCICGKVQVGEACYLGAGSCVIEGATIGAQSLVGIGAVVIRDVAPNSVVVGNPARFLRRVVE